MNKVMTEIFCFVDEFCKFYEAEVQKIHLTSGNVTKKPARKPMLSLSEIVTILIMYSFSPCKNFKFYYLTYLNKKDFPSKLSYQRFIELQPRAMIIIAAIANACKGEENGHYYVDATTLAVCHNKRIFRNKVFKGIAEIGKSTMGWFYGFKLHLLINPRGEVMNIAITKGNVTDINMLETLVKALMEKVYGDKGYISSKVFERLLNKGMQLVTGIKKTMKNKLMDLQDKVMLRKRSLIETVFDYLKNKFNLEHSRHRSPINFLIHILSTVIAYQFLKTNLQLQK